MPLSNKKLWIYVREIEIQCGHAQYSFDCVNRALAELANLRSQLIGLNSAGSGGNIVLTQSEKPKLDALYDKVFFYVQAFLAHAGNISKILWPARVTPASQARATDLHLALQVPANLQLESRDIRNSLEHVDERIDSWLAAKSDADVVVIDMNIEHTSASTASFRKFKSDSLTYYFADDSIALADISTEVAALRKSAQLWIENAQI